MDFPPEPVFPLQLEPGEKYKLRLDNVIYYRGFKKKELKR